MGKSHQIRPIADASEALHISPPATFNVVRHTHASHLAMVATPMGVIAAQLGRVDTSRGVLASFGTGVSKPSVNPL
jgi:hypothetical protein